MSRLKVTLVRSPIGLDHSQRETCEALGLHKIRRVRFHQDTPVIRGMVHKVRHLVTVESMEEDASAAA